MLIGSPFVGDWMASAYSSNGRRRDYRLFLDPDGSFERSISGDLGQVKTDRGKWHHSEGEETLRLEPEPPNPEYHPDSWWILSVPMCEESNCLMMLRWAGLASRNLPILFYRAQLPGRWYSEGLELRP
jgi:hypothetical protein